jgi:two-component system nitrogen regulation response regulator NtrX
MELKKLKENSRAVKPKDEDGNGTKKLRDIQDLQNKIRIENLKKEIKSNKEIIKADETLYTEKIRLASLNASMEARISELSLKDARNNFEKDYLISQIKRFNGNIIKISEFTGMERTALYRKFKSLNIEIDKK